MAKPKMTPEQAREKFARYPRISYEFVEALLNGHIEPTTHYLELLPVLQRLVNRLNVVRTYVATKKYNYEVAAKIAEVMAYALCCEPDKEVIDFVQRALQYFPESLDLSVMSDKDFIKFITQITANTKEGTLYTGLLIYDCWNPWLHTRYW
jgi:hypothetical protein